jgi:hypothetical protein
MPDTQEARRVPDPEVHDSRESGHQVLIDFRLLLVRRTEYSPCNAAR